MPKIVNHRERKDRIADAALRVIRKEGLDNVSVRKVADEAGLSLGALRHYFDTQHELLAYAMRLVSTRVNERMSALPLTGEPRHDVQLAVAELLPLDDVRMAEAEIWLAFAGKSLSDPDIRRISQQVQRELYEGFRRMIDWLAARGDVREGLDLRAEARRLHAFVDGLALHIVTAADKPDPDEARKLVSYHLDSLLAR